MTWAVLRNLGSQTEVCRTLKNVGGGLPKKLYWSPTKLWESPIMTLASKMKIGGVSDDLDGRGSCR